MRVGWISIRSPDMTNEAARRRVLSIEIVSGGQTGADRGALDAAMELGFPVGGWCPAGRRAEDGPIPSRYPLKETPSPEYAVRTAWNVRDSSGTLIFSAGELVGGTAFTVREARQRRKPLMVIDPYGFDPIIVREWIEKHGIDRLNVAGPRESEQPGIYRAVRDGMMQIVGGLVDDSDTPDPRVRRG